MINERLTRGKCFLPGIVRFVFLSFICFRCLLVMEGNAFKCWRCLVDLLLVPNVWCAMLVHIHCEVLLLKVCVVVGR